MSARLQAWFPVKEYLAKALGKEQLLAPDITMVYVKHSLASLVGRGPQPACRGQGPCLVINDCWGGLERWVAGGGVEGGGGRGRRSSTFLAYLGGRTWPLRPCPPASLRVTLGRSPVRRKTSQMEPSSVWLWFVRHSAPLVGAFDEEPGLRLTPQPQNPAPLSSHPPRWASCTAFKC